MRARAFQQAIHSSAKTWTTSSGFLKQLAIKARVAIAILGNMDQRKLKILCLHGYRQNELAFKSKLGGFRKIVKKYADLVFITAPLIVPQTKNGENENVESNPDNDQRGWWFSKVENSFNAHDISNICNGFDRSMEKIALSFEQEGPFDGILGFSQGAALVAILSGLKEQKKLPYDFKFAILIAAFKSKSSPHDDAFLVNISCPSLHVIGETDRIIPKETSEQLLKHFSNNETLFHPGGHFVPTAGPQKERLVNFLTKMQTLCNPLQVST